MIYRTKQVNVEARRLGSPEDIGVDNDATMEWCGGVLTNSIIDGPRFHIPARRVDALRATPSNMAKPGEWIVKHDDEFLVFGDAEFKARYEVVMETTKLAEPKPPKPVAPVVNNG